MASEAEDNKNPNSEEEGSLLPPIPPEGGGNDNNVDPVDKAIIAASVIDDLDGTGDVPRHDPGTPSSGLKRQGFDDEEAPVHESPSKKVKTDNYPGDTHHSPSTPGGSSNTHKPPSGHDDQPLSHHNPQPAANPLNNSNGNKPTDNVGHQGVSAPSTTTSAPVPTTPNNQSIGSQQQQQHGQQSHHQAYPQSSYQHHQAGYYPSMYGQYPGMMQPYPPYSYPPAYPGQQPMMPPYSSTPPQQAAHSPLAAAQGQPQQQQSASAQQQQQQQPHHHQGYYPPPPQDHTHPSSPSRPSYGYGMMTPMMPPYGYGPPGMFFGHYPVPNMMSPISMQPYTNATSGGGGNHHHAPGSAGSNSHHQPQKATSSHVQAPPPRRSGITLALSCDDEQLSEYQMLVRKQLEIFEALPEDVESNTQGRKKQVVLGQVGIRCKHCSGLPLRQRGRGAVYYPARLQGVYQAAQNMASSHLCESCQCIAPHLKADLRNLRDRRDTASGGKQYWADGARAMGLVETEEGLRLRRPEGNNTQSPS